MNTPKTSLYQLDNGLRILVLPRSHVPKVSVQLWYAVGSKDEKDGEKGIAHLIEHMLFKGTEKLSESDINLITHKLSGSCNAFTSYDYTGYLFDFPSQHWHYALQILCDTMENASFKDELLTSELKAVIQELKMYKDDYISTITEQMLGAIFQGHPYHHPIIGYKHDLWSLSREKLVNFYKKYYIPRNATLIVVGDVLPDDVLKQAQKYFGSLPSGNAIIKQENYFSPDVRTQSVTIYRDIQQPFVLYSWVLPGVSAKKDFIIDTLSWILSSGKGSRLYKKLVNEMELATDVEGFFYDLFEHGMFFIRVHPTSEKNIQKIAMVIEQELTSLIRDGVQECELERAVKKISADYLHMAEDNQKYAYGLGKYLLATGDPDFFINYVNLLQTALVEKTLGKQVQELVREYARPTLMNCGSVFPVSEQDREYWLHFQELSDTEDERVLKGRVREGVVEDGRAVDAIEVLQQKLFAFPQPEKFILDNGLTVIMHHMPTVAKTELLIDTKTKHYYDPENKLGLGEYAAQLMLEGTQQRPGNSFSDWTESLGMNIDNSAGQLSVSVLSTDLEQGLEAAHQILTQATFDEEAVEQIRSRITSEIKELWDSPTRFISLLAREAVYKQHPYHKSNMGSLDSISRITRNDLINYYKKTSSPHEARLIIVGDLSEKDVKNLVLKKLGLWQGDKIADLTYPSLSVEAGKNINYPMARDQVVLGYAGVSVNRLSPDYDVLFLYDQIFTGGVLHSMSSRLFDLREQSGLFYTIGGSLVHRVDTQPGMIFIKTIVSPDRLIEAENAIERVLDTGIDTVTEQELESARQAIVCGLLDLASTQAQTAGLLLAQDIYDFSHTYFAKRADMLAKITLADLKNTVKKYISSKKLVKIRVGRVA